MVKFCIGIMLHKWTKTGIRKVFRLKLECIKNLSKTGQQKTNANFILKESEEETHCQLDSLLSPSLVRAVGRKSSKKGAGYILKFRSCSGIASRWGRPVSTKAQPFWMLKLSIVTSCQGSAFRGAEAVHCNFRLLFSLLSWCVPPFLVFPLSLAMFIYLFSVIPTSPPLSFLCATTCFKSVGLTAFANSSVWVLAECKPDGPAVPTVISQPTLASLPLSFLPWQERNICLYLGRLVRAAVPLP